MKYKEEAVIQENLSSLQLPTQLTENIMKEISRLNPVTPSGSKPLVPLAVSAASAILVMLLIGFGAQNQIRFQQPYSLESTSEQTIEIVDTPNGTSVFQWIEEKQHWKSMGSLSQQVSCLAVVDGFLYAGTNGSGVYKIRIEK